MKMLKCKLVKEISENNDYNLCMFLKKIYIVWLLKTLNLLAQN